MEGLLEQQRGYHEERERLVDAMVHEQLEPRVSHKERLLSEHRVRQMRDRHADVTRRLQELYEDKEGDRRREIQALSGPNEFQEFYNRLKDVKDFYKRHPDEAIANSLATEFRLMKENKTSEAENLVDFTDEESFGRFLDLHETHSMYVNIKTLIGKVDYVTYLSMLQSNNNVLPMFALDASKKNNEYRNHLSALLDYLIDFLHRSKPLLDVDAMSGETRKAFEEKLESNSLTNWTKEQLSGDKTGKLTNLGSHLDLSAFSSWQELSALGLDRLKSALMALGLKCGGTLEQRAQRLFSTKGKALHEIDTNLFVKKDNKGDNDRKKVERLREMAWMEYHVTHIVTNLLSEQLTDTLANVSAKRGRAGHELEDDEDEDQEEQEEDEDPNDDDIPYNPKNLPLGWDGKPIPYWLYKLHGLNISYNCEICGNFVYKGPKAFQRHFSEWRHAHGMRCLGIPNTAHFANVTQIEDAMALWERLRTQKIQQAWKPEHEEEFEDSQGNVVSRKTFEDLKRQGLL